MVQHINVRKKYKECVMSMLVFEDLIISASSYVYDNVLFC